MASPSQVRKDGVRCDGTIQKGRRKGEICGMLLLAKEPTNDAFTLVCSRPQCGASHSLPALLRKAEEREVIFRGAVFTVSQGTVTGETQMTSQEQEVSTQDPCRKISLFTACFQGACERLLRDDLPLPKRFLESPQTLTVMKEKARELEKLFDYHYLDPHRLFECTGLVLRLPFYDYSSEQAIKDAIERGFLSTLEHLDTLTLEAEQRDNGIVAALAVTWHTPFDYAGNKHEKSLVARLDTKYGLSYEFPVQSIYNSEVTNKLVLYRPNGVVVITKTNIVWVETR